MHLFSTLPQFITSVRQMRFSFIVAVSDEEFALIQPEWDGPSMFERKFFFTTQLASTNEEE